MIQKLSSFNAVPRQAHGASQFGGPASANITGSPSNNTLSNTLSDRPADVFFGQAGWSRGRRAAAVVLVVTGAGLLAGCTKAVPGNDSAVAAQLAAACQPDEKMSCSDAILAGFQNTDKSLQERWPYLVEGLSVEMTDVDRLHLVVALLEDNTDLDNQENSDGEPLRFTVNDGFSGVVDSLTEYLQQHVGPAIKNPNLQARVNNLLAVRTAIDTDRRFKGDFNEHDLFGLYARLHGDLQETLARHQLARQADEQGYTLVPKAKNN